jgi:hypothetical protein
MRVVYSGCSKTGYLDGIDIDLDALVGLNFQEVANGLTLTNHMAFPAVLVVSEATWSRMSDEEKAVFTDAAEDALAWALSGRLRPKPPTLKSSTGKSRSAALRRVPKSSGRQRRLPRPVWQQRHHSALPRRGTPGGQ